VPKFHVLRHVVERRYSSTHSNLGIGSVSLFSLASMFVKCFHCHQSKASSRFVNRNIQIWRVDANILNNTLREAENGWSSIIVAVVLRIEVPSVRNEVPIVEKQSLYILSK
jgi:hypothetical protein